MLAGMKSEWVAGFVSESMAGFIGIRTLHAKIGELTLENDFLSGALGKAGLLGGKK